MPHADSILSSGCFKLACPVIDYECMYLPLTSPFSGEASSLEISPYEGFLPEDICPSSTLLRSMQTSIKGENLVVLSVERWCFSSAT